MFEFLRNLVGILAPVFVISAMLNVGLTQQAADIAAHLKNHRFVLKMLLANFVLAPLLMMAALSVIPFDPALQAGLLIFSLAAGAPFLIKLTQTAEHSVALGAAIMILLIVATVVYVPLVLPRVLSGVAVDGWLIARSLSSQMLLPIVVGMLAARFLPRITGSIQPTVARVANLSLYALLAATLVGFLPNLRNIVGSGALAVGVAFVAASFGIGYWMGRGQDHLEDVGGLATAQRNTAAGVLIATQNFEDPNVLVILTLVNALGIVMLLVIAKKLSQDTHVTGPTLSWSARCTSCVSPAFPSGSGALQRSATRNNSGRSRS